MKDYLRQRETHSHIERKWVDKNQNHRACGANSQGDDQGRKYMAMGELEDPTARVSFVLFPEPMTVSVPCWKKITFILSRDV